MATVGTIIANIVANTTKFSAPLKKAQADVKNVHSEMKKLQNVAKVGVGILGAEQIKSFFSNTIKTATTAGSALQNSGLPAF